MKSNHDAGLGAVLGGVAGAGLGSLIGAGTGEDDAAPTIHQGVMQC